MLKVRNMEGSSGREVANQFVITDTENNKVTFQSYDSTIIEIDSKNGVITVHPDYNYSKTTGKYRNKFMEVYFGALVNIKELEKAMSCGYWGNWKVVKAF